MRSTMQYTIFIAIFQIGLFQIRTIVQAPVQNRYSTKKLKNIREEKSGGIYMQFCTQIFQL